MGTWGHQPWDNDGAADWFTSLFDGIDIDGHIDRAFATDDGDEIRAAGYILTVLGRPYIWPGDLERLDGHLERGIELLTEFLDEDSEFRELWEDDPEALAAVRAELAALEARLDGDAEATDDDDEDNDDEDEDEEDEEDEEDDEE